MCLSLLSHRNIPFTIVLISFVLWAIGLLDSVFPIMFNAGTLVSWIYLRFYQKHSNRGFGDGSDSFTFARQANKLHHLNVIH